VLRIAAITKCLPNSNHFAQQSLQKELSYKHVEFTNSKDVANKRNGVSLN
jgi:hypothetical protein